ncbi:amidohydrolase family protein [soil metagenome]|jgi:predicted TIM-barrel fold metal-dependent hydrolase
MTETEKQHDISTLTSGAMAPIWEWVEERIPPDTGIFDAHAHIGEDLDGRTMTADGMRERMKAAHVKKSIVFALNDPNALEDFSGPNDVVWRAHEEHPGFFVPFFRLNPHKEYEREFERCVERGFSGLKLHPVSQKFELDDERAVRLFEMAAKADLPVIIHAGFGMNRIVEALLPTIEGNPELRLILGHAAFVEILQAARVFADHPNVIFETSVARAAELYELFASFDPSRICFGSDIPYGDLPSTLYATLAAAEAAGIEKEHLRGILAENIRRWFP